MGPTEAEAASNIIHIAYSRVIINNRATTPRLGSESPWGHTGVGRLVTVVVSWWYFICSSPAGRVSIATYLQTPPPANNNAG